MQAQPLTNLQASVPKGVSVSVLGAHQPLARSDIHRLLEANGDRLRGPRRARLIACSKILISHQAHVVGLAAYQNVRDELRVCELAIASDAACGPERIVDAALDALELACLASGACRLVVTARAGTCLPALWHRGFVRIDDRSPRSWLEKRFQR